MGLKRIEYIDIAKGLGIILVVIGHCINGKTFPGTWISSFHMPLFFILSGMCFNASSYSSIIPFLHRRVNTLFLPLLFFSILMIILKSLFLPDSFTFIDLRYRFPGGAHWFVFILFLSEILFYIINNISSKKIIKLFFIFICLIFSALFIKYKIILPYNISSIFIATFYYGIGYIYKNNINNIIKKINGYIGKLYSLILLLIPAISVCITKQTIDLSSNSIPYPMFYHIFISLIGVIGILLFSKVFFSSNTMIKLLIIYIGKNTLIILLLHMFFISISSKYILPNIINIFLYKIIEQIFVWTLLFVSIYIINKKMKWIIGK